jgi:DNA-binding NarL/FixJ family response regulator
MEAARLGSQTKDAELLAVARKAAADTKTAMEQLPGHAPWGAQADAALARVALAEGNTDEALTAARTAVTAMMASRHEDSHLEVLVPVVEALAAGGQPEELGMARGFLQILLALTAQRTFDEDVRVRWFRGPLGRETVQAAGALDGMSMQPAAAEDAPKGMNEDQTALLKLLTEGLTNQEIAERLGISPEQVTSQLIDTFARIGANSRAEATAFAFRERVV